VLGVDLLSLKLDVLVGVFRKFVLREFVNVDFELVEFLLRWLPSLLIKRFGLFFDVGEVLHNKEE
jgi:hypothetical protein